LLYATAVTRDLPPFPTRRSSDLVERDGLHGGRDRRRAAALRPLGDEGALPHVGARAAGRDQLLVGERHGAPVDAELAGQLARGRDRKSTRLNSSHVAISYAVFCL